MFTSKKRVIRNGFLVAFEGEVMSDEEAAARGLLDPEPEEKPKAKPKPKPEPVEDEDDEGYDEDEES